MSSSASLIFRTKTVSNIYEMTIEQLFDEKTKALSPIDFEDNCLSERNSLFPFDSSSNSVIDQDEDNLVIVSSRSDDQFTLRMNEQIKQLETLSKL
jgi:hypothetical protein